MQKLGSIMKMSSKRMSKKLILSQKCLLILIASRKDFHKLTYYLVSKKNEI